MSAIAVADCILRLREDGRLADISQWSVEVAEKLAARESLVLTDEHWRIIGFMRDYYHEFGISPILKLLKKGLRRKFPEVSYSDEDFCRLFPGGVMHQGTRIAGIPPACLDAELEPVAAVLPSSSGAPDDRQKYRELKVGDKCYRLTATGNLYDLHDWDEQLAHHLAAIEGIELTSDHWEVINYLRKFFFSYGITPMVKILMRSLAEDIGEGKATRKYLYHLFPQGPSRQGSRIAGLPAPQGCIDP